jgi:hypothetical protein
MTTNCYLAVFDVWLTTAPEEQATRYPVAVEAFNAMDAATQASIKLSVTLGLEELVAAGVRLPRLLEIRPDVEAEHERLKREILDATRGTRTETFVRAIFGDKAT